jgi:transcriptional regulator with XRE-family HTH domain
MKYFSSNLKFLRKSRGLTQAEIQSDTGIEMTTWGNYERGKSFPKLELFSEITKYFGISAEDLLNSDLSNVHLNKSDNSGKNAQNVHLNVHPSVHLNIKKGADYAPVDQSVTLLEESLTPPQSEQNVVETMAVAIRGLERANARLEQLVERLEEENRRLKQEIPSIGQDLEAGNARAS